VGIAFQGHCRAFCFKLSKRTKKGYEESRAGRKEVGNYPGVVERSGSCLPLRSTARLPWGARDKSSLGHDGFPPAQGHTAIVRHVIVTKEQIKGKQAAYILQAWEEVEEEGSRTFIKNGNVLSIRD